jgi:hypothetical protein
MNTTAGTWLVPESARAITPHRNPARPGRPWALDLVVVHYTATPWSARHPEQAGSDRGRQLAWLRGERGKTSTHLDVLRGGEVLQGAPLEDRTWHSGGSAWTSPEGTPRDDVNRRSIGIDLDNAIDEALGGYATLVTVTLNADGSVTVTDNGPTVAVSVASSAVSVDVGVVGPPGAAGATGPTGPEGPGSNLFLNTFFS